MSQTRDSVATPLSSLAVAVAEPAVLAQIDAAMAVAVATENDGGAGADGDEQKGKKEKADKSKKGDLFRLANDYQRRSIEFADRKATFIVFGANAFASFLDRSAGLKGVRQIPIAQWTLKIALGEAGMLMLAAGGFTALWVIVPRVSRKVGKGAVYWEAIRKHESAAEWIEAMQNITEEEATETLLRSTYDLAGINVTKYRTLQTATWLGGIGMVLALLHIAL